MKTKRGQKLCSNCETINGVRAYECKQCSHKFKMKRGRISPKNKRVEDHMTLHKGDLIRVVGGSGCYYLDKQGDKHYFTDRGKYTVCKIHKDYILANGSYGSSHLYMGKKRRSKLLDSIWDAPHKIMLLKEAS
jgi:hypothetical protein